MDERMCIVKCSTTEKSALINKNSCFCFIVKEYVNKIMVKKCVEKMFNVKVVKVNMCSYLTKPKKKYLRKGISERKIHTYKKAYVFLKKGEQLNFDNII